MNDRDIVVFKCLNCGHNAAFKIHGEYTHEINSFDKESLVPEEQRDALLFYVYKWRLLECLVCSKPTLVEIGDLKNYSDQTEYYEDYEASVIAASTRRPKSLCGKIGGKSEGKEGRINARTPTS